MNLNRAVADTYVVFRYDAAYPKVLGRRVMIRRKTHMKKHNKVCENVPVIPMISINAKLYYVCM